MINYSDPRQYDWNLDKISPDPRDWGSDEDLRFPVDDEQVEPDENEDWQNDNNHEGA